MKRVYATIWPHRRAKNFERKTEIYGKTESGRHIVSTWNIQYMPHSLCWWLVGCWLLVVAWLCVWRTYGLYKQIEVIEVSHSQFQCQCWCSVVVKLHRTHHSTSSRALSHYPSMWCVLYSMDLVDMKRDCIFQHIFYECIEFMFKVWIFGRIYFVFVFSSNRRIDSDVSIQADLMSV